MSQFQSVEISYLIFNYLEVDFVSEEEENVAKLPQGIFLQTKKNKANQVVEEIKPLLDVNNIIENNPLLSPFNFN